MSFIILFLFVLLGILIILLTRFLINLIKNYRKWKEIFIALGRPKWQQRLIPLYAPLELAKARGRPIILGVLHLFLQFLIIEGFILSIIFVLKSIFFLINPIIANQINVLVNKLSLINLLKLNIVFCGFFVSVYISYMLYEESRGLFSLNYQNVPGYCVYAEGGLKFRADEAALRRYFAPILSYISLNELIGEAVFWTLLPSTLAIWVFPVFLYFKGVSFALRATLILSIIADMVYQVFYSKLINYIIFILANKLLALIFYLVLETILIRFNFVKEAIVLMAWGLFSISGLIEIIFLPIDLILVKFFGLAKSDQVLRNIGWHYGRKLGLNPLQWKMYD